MAKRIIDVSTKMIDTKIVKRFFVVENSSVNVTYSDGTDGRVYFNEVTRSKRSTDSVCFLPVVYEDGNVVKVMLRKGLRPATRDGELFDENAAGNGLLWEAPAGTFEPEDSEDVEGARRRAAAELLEECGIDGYWSITVLDPPFYTSPGMSAERMWFCQIDVTGVPQKDPEGDGSSMEEGAICQWFSPEELPNMLDRGEIRDMKTAFIVMLFGN